MAMIFRRSFISLLKLPMYPKFIPFRSFAIDDDADINPMRTTVTILNQEQDEGIFIDSYSPVGFMLNSGIRLIGPCAVFPRSVLHWNVQNVEDINENSLSLFTMLEPKIDILVLGVGERENLKKISLNVIKHLRAKKINVELLATDQALATFNFLNSEKRYVAGAFIPPTYMDDSEEPEMYLSNEPDNSTVVEVVKIKGQKDDDISHLLKEESLVTKMMEKVREGSQPTEHAERTMPPSESSEKKTK